VTTTVTSSQATAGNPCMYVYLTILPARRLPCSVCVRVSLANVFVSLFRSLLCMTLSNNIYLLTSFDTAAPTLSLLSCPISSLSSHLVLFFFFFFSFFSVSRWSSSAQVLRYEARRVWHGNQEIKTDRDTKIQRHE
jgi:hypothetical protein